VFAAFLPPKKRRKKPPRGDKILKNSKARFAKIAMHHQSHHAIFIRSARLEFEQNFSHARN